MLKDFANFSEEYITELRTKSKTNDMVNYNLTDGIYTIVAISGWGIAEEMEVLGMMEINDVYSIYTKYTAYDINQVFLANFYNQYSIEYDAEEDSYKVLSSTYIEETDVPENLEFIVTGSHFDVSEDILEETEEVYKNEDYVIRVDIDLDDFVSLFIDDILVPSENYELESGSTILTLSKDYMNELSEGEHEVTLIFDGNKYVETTVTVSKVENPKTGINNNYIIMISIALIGLISYVIVKNRNKLLKNM